MVDIDNSEDTIDVRDVIARFEELETERDDFVSGAPDGSETPDPQGWAADNPEESSELDLLTTLLEELKGYGGDEQWRGDWYPVTLLRRSHFVDAMRELVEECYLGGKELPSFIEIDWQKTADNLEQDYAGVDYDGVEYLYR